MASMTATNQSAGGTSLIEAQKLWAKYEDIAMHFNDLLMRLRSQSLAGIAAASTLVGIFTKEGVSDIHVGWLAATAIFAAMGSFWLAIFCLDFFYYNRLLTASVKAITALEAAITSNSVDRIEMSTVIEAEFKTWPKLKGFFGVLSFYVIVSIVIGSGIIFSACQSRH